LNLKILKPNIGLVGKKDQ